MYLLGNTDGCQYPGEDPPYVLELISLPSGLAVISTDQTLCLFDPLRLSEGPKLRLQTNHGNVTAVKAFDVSGSVLATAGENGSVALWDLRDGTSRSQRTVQAGSCDASIASLACQAQTNALAVGTNVSNHQASIIIWDTRSSAQPKTQYNEVHSDDVTELKYHPDNPDVLLSGSTDGLVNICDTRISDEDEVVIQAFNHGASIHRAGFLNSTETYALSHDEKLALYDMAEEQERGSAMVDFGDMRTFLGCQYVASLSPKPNQAGAILGAGSQDQELFQLVHLSKAPQWAFDKESVVGLPGAHGSELVRTFCVLDEEKVVYTGGEDGWVKAWKPAS